MICVLRGKEGDRVIPAGAFENVTAGYVVGKEKKSNKLWPRRKASLWIFVNLFFDKGEAVKNGYVPFSNLARYGPNSWCDANNTLLTDALCAGHDEEYCQEERGKLRYIDGIPGTLSVIRTAAKCCARIMLSVTPNKTN